MKRMILIAAAVVAACGVENTASRSVYDEPAPDPNDTTAVREMQDRVVTENTEAGRPTAMWEGHLLNLWAMRERAGGEAYGDPDPSPGTMPATVGEAIDEERAIQEAAMAELSKM